MTESRKNKNNDQFFDIGEKVVTSLEEGIFRVLGYDKLNDRYRIGRKKGGKFVGHIFNLPGLLIGRVKKDENGKGEKVQVLVDD